ncbi:MAG: DegV family protein [Oscillospiraceae bacterium]|nr:DegV family protein [Oscillospiraceae bacterium]
MKDYVIFTDGGASLLPAICQEYDIRGIAMDCLLNGENFSFFAGQDNAEEVCASFYQSLKEGASVSTSQITLFTFEEAFAPILEEGHDLLYCCFSGGLSATWQMAQQALGQLKERYPDRTIRFVNTLSAAAGLGLFVVQAARNRANGMSLEENAHWLEEHALSCCHWFTVSDLDFLKRGGRVSPTAAFFGSKLNIRPMLKIEDDGKLVVYGKVRGQNASMDNMLTRLKETFDPALTDTVWVDYAGVPELGEALAEEVRKAVPQVEVKTVPLSPIIGAHTGPGMLSVCHFGTKR